MVPIPVYLATVCLERNRWGSRRPSLRVSDWLARVEADGFAGVELWENHYLAADANEQARLRAARGRVAMFNTYAGLGDGDAAQRRHAADAVLQLSAPALKFNLGNDPARIDEYRRNLLTWAAALPASCQLLCECHPGTVLEHPEAAAAFLTDLDASRFGVIAHCSSAAAAMAPWLEALGPRVRHLHVQLREPQDATPAGRAKLVECVAVLRRHGFAGSASIEFTRGIGPAEQVEALYADACADRAALRAAWERP